MNYLNRELRFAAEAHAEFLEAARWYEDRRKGLGAQFVLMVEAKLSYIRKSPAVFPVVYQDYRRAVVKRFPFAIFYEVVEESIHVLAVHHTSREPSSLKDR